MLPTHTAPCWNRCACPSGPSADSDPAHWAAAAVFDVSADFETNHAQALVLALHRNQLADAYSIFLFDDYEQVKERINASLASLAFLP